MKKEKFSFKLTKNYKKFSEKTGFKNPLPRKIKDFLYKKIEAPEFTTVMGHKMYLAPHGPISLELATKGIWEESETELIKKIVSDGDVVLDLGANIGYYTMIFAKLIGPKGKVFAFEPEPNNFELLKKNLTINGYQNSTIEDAAVSDENGEIKLYLSEGRATNHRTFHSKSVSKNFVVVKKVKLDDYFKNNPIRKRISFVKMDVEGSELDALKGMTSILNENKNIKILIEFAPQNIREFGAQPSDLLKILRNHGFSLYEVNSENKNLELVNDEDLLKLQNVVINLLCKKE